MRRIIIFLIISGLFCINAGPRATAHIPAPTHTAIVAPSAERAGPPPYPATVLPNADPADPLPHDCGTVTPPGEPHPACCLSGIVYSDGQIITGAEVQIEKDRDNQLQLFTQVYSGTESRAHYQVNLSAAPLNIAENETITITARYDGRVRSLRHTVLPGSQQVDIVLPRPQNEDYIFERQIWSQGTAGTFRSPDGIAVYGNSRVYVADAFNAQVQIFSIEGTPLGRWGTLGNQVGQFDTPHGVAVDQSGNVYVADWGNHRIQKFDSNGRFITSWGGVGSDDGQFRYPSNVGVDVDGMIYVTDWGNHRVQKFTSDGRFIDSWDSQDQGNPQLNTPYGIAVSRGGDVYVADTGNDRIVQFRRDGTFVRTWDSQGSAAGKLNEPRNVAVGAGGVVYVTDRANNRVQMFDARGNYIRSWGELGSGPRQFNFPVGIAVSSSGAVYVTERTNHRVQKFGSQGNFLGQWGSEGRGPGQFHSPEGLTIDDTNALYVADTRNHRIQKLSDHGILIWGSYGSGNGQFRAPTAVAVDAQGFIYVADRDNHRIQKFNRSLTMSDKWGTKGNGNGQFQSPTGVAVDRQGFVYVADRDNHRIQKFTSLGAHLLSWGNEGSGNRQFQKPTAVAVDGQGFVYVADHDNHRIQKFTSLGVHLLSWGSQGSGNGQFQKPAAVAVDAQGFVYVADHTNNRIQKFDGDGTFLAAWGRAGNEPGLFDQASGVAVDRAGHVYVSDLNNHRLQVFRPATVTRPIATIVHLNAITFSATDNIVAHGMGQDSDATPDDIIAYRWTSDKDGVLGTAAILSRPAASLSAGTHRLTLEVQDAEGEWSEPASKWIYVARPPQTQWTMLLYLAGDDGEGTLSWDFIGPLIALRTQLRNPYVRIAAQVDGPANGDTYRLLIEPGTATTNPIVTELPQGEAAMDDPAMLADFVRWGQSSFPAVHYYLAIADHGQGIQGIAWDHTSDPNDGANLTVKELGQALSAPGVAPIDVLHLDACAMDLLEVVYEVRQSAQVVIASQYLGWGYFAYDTYHHAIGLSTEAPDLARGITARYAEHARADANPFTIAAIDTQRAEPMLTALDALAVELTALVNNDAGNRAVLQGLWEASQKFESNGDYLNNNLDLYIDLVDWATRVESGVDSPAVRERAGALLDELTGPQSFIINESNYAQSNRLPREFANGEYIDLTRSNGVSIFYPQHHEANAYMSYINNQLFSFTAASRWPDFLRAAIGSPHRATPLPGPLASLSVARSIRFLPLIRR